MEETSKEATRLHSRASVNVYVCVYYSNSTVFSDSRSVICQAT